MIVQENMSHISWQYSEGYQITLQTTVQKNMYVFAFFWIYVFNSKGTETERMCTYWSKQ
jgi:hypothetical protein